ncbi:MAG: chromosomal replication initiator protein DnaA [Actinobacteria bacterium]|nr:MAG: chromosomal replication initiator protein DnaA [Actinomycetota bacterium]
MGDVDAVESVASEVAGIWARVLEIMRPNLNAASFSTWFAQAVPLRVDGDTLVIGAPNQFTRDWLVKYTDRTREALAEVLGRAAGVIFVVDPQASGGVPEPAPVIEVAPVPASSSSGEPEGVRPEPPARPAGSTFDPAQTFETFVMGDSNQFAYSAALAVAERPGRAYNPLFIYGGVGLGKTHLLQAIGSYVADHFPHMRVRYVTAEQFMNEFIGSIGDKQRIDGFRQRYRTNDVILVDDIQVLSKKEGTQDAFFHTFNTLHQAGRQIVLASDRPPGEIPMLEERLRSRFSSGLVVDIQPPDLEMRIAILRRTAAGDDEHGGKDVSDDVLAFIAERVSSSIRELNSALLRVLFYGSLSHKAIDIALAQQVLRDSFPEHSARPISVATIQSEVCRHYGVSRTELVGAKRTQSIVYPRQIAMYLARELTDHSLPRIGSEFGNRDHTTVLHAVTKIQKLMSEHRDVYDQIQTISSAIRQKS